MNKKTTSRNKGIGMVDQIRNKVKPKNQDEDLHKGIFLGRSLAQTPPFFK